jgi:glutamate dehydrogenase
MFGLSTQAHKKHIQTAKRNLKKTAPAAILSNCNRTIELFFGGMSVEEIELHDSQYWTNVVIEFVKSIKKNLPGSSVVRVFNPTIKSHGYENHHTVIQIACQDMPFLVDSVALVFSGFGLDMDLMSHPIASLERSKAGILKDITKDSEYQESWMHIEISKIADQDKIDELLKELDLVIGKVTVSVQDWQPILSKMKQAKNELSTKNSQAICEKQHKFIDWLLDANFTFLGYQHYQKNSNSKVNTLTPTKKSALGLYTDSRYLSDIDPLNDKDYHVKKQSDLIIITKLNVRPRVHRAGTLDYIGVLVINEKDQVIAEHRFVGLFTSAAMNTSPWDIPYINDKVSKVAKSFKFDKNSHTGKHITHIIETLPRAEIMQSSSTELNHTLLSILTIQDRQKSNVTVRKDKFKRFYAFLVHIPRDKFNTNIRHTIQEILSDEVSGTNIEFQVKIGATNLTRLYVTVYSNASPKLNTSDIEEKISHALRSWVDELEEILIEKNGEELGTALTEKYANNFPMAYLEDVAPRVAAYDVGNASKLASTGELQLSLYRPRDISRKIFRFKIFRNDNTIPLSEVLPVLENLGLHVVRERPYEISLDNGTSIWIQDFDLSLAHGAELELELVKERFKEAFKQIISGSVDDDGFNKLLILGGLTSRQIIILRAISKYLKQTNLPFSQEYLEKALVSQSHISRWLIELFGVKFDVSLDDLSTKEYKDY